MRETVRFLADYLEKVAGITPLPSEVGEPPLFTIEIRHEGVRYVFKIPCHPEHIRERAEQLRKRGRALGNGLSAQTDEFRLASGWKPRLSRPKKYSKAIAQRFLDDGEKENWAAYRDLFDA